MSSWDVFRTFFRICVRTGHGRMNKKLVVNTLVYRHDEKLSIFLGCGEKG